MRLMRLSGWYGESMRHSLASRGFKTAGFPKRIDWENVSKLKTLWDKKKYRKVVIVDDLNRWVATASGGFIKAEKGTLAGDGITKKQAWADYLKESRAGNNGEFAFSKDREYHLFGVDDALDEQDMLGKKRQW